MNASDFRAWRRAENLTVNAAADRLGIARTSVMRYEADGPPASVEKLIAALAEVRRLNTLFYPLPSVANGHPEQGAFLSGWREIESAPMDGRSVLVFCPRASDHGYERIRLTWRKDGKWQGANNTSWPPTHWMPLPAPPPLPADGAAIASTTDVSRVPGTNNNTAKGGE